MKTTQEASVHGKSREEAVGHTVVATPDNKVLQQSLAPQSQTASRRVEDSGAARAQDKGPETTTTDRKQRGRGDEVSQGSRDPATLHNAPTGGNSFDKGALTVGGRGKGANEAGGSSGSTGEQQNGKTVTLRARQQTGHKKGEPVTFDGRTVRQQPDEASDAATDLVTFPRQTSTTTAGGVHRRPQGNVPQAVGSSAGQASDSASFAGSKKTGYKKSSVHDASKSVKGSVGDASSMSAEEWRARESNVPAGRQPENVANSSARNPETVLGAEARDLGADNSAVDDFNSRDVDLEEDESSKKFSKKTSNKGSNFGSSTTLSSATEVSDDSDEVFHVVLRVRPLSSQEKQRRDIFAVTFPGDGKCAVDNSGSSRNFQFNVVFEPDASQEVVFENSGIKRLVDNAVAGYNCTAFAFGQTGSGKTHTMTGPPAQNRDANGNKIAKQIQHITIAELMEYHQPGLTPDPQMYGIIQRSFKYMYKQIKQQGGGKIIRASYLEVYNEQVIDLLNNSHKRYLSVRWSKNKGFYVENLFTVECETLDDLMAVLEEGLKNRQTGSHGLNEFSSRSHSVLTVTIDSETQPDTEDESLYVTKRGKLSFVDLAGSEKVKDASGSFGGPGMLESNSINKSLLVLGNCISHLGDAKRRQGHIPYRDSKLTKLLSDSLGGHGITLMIACITPSSANITETMNTLRYASRAKKIKTKPTVKMDPREKLIMSLKREIKILRNENHYLRQQLDFPAKPKGQLQKENDEKFMKFMKEQKEKETGLYEMLQEYMVENENLRSENSEMHSTRDRIRREQQLLYRENEKLMKRVEELERVVSQNPSFWAMAQHPERTDGYGQFDLASPRSSPVAPGFQSGLAQKGYTGQASPPGSRGKGNHPGPMRPPHRLSDSVVRPAQRPAEVLENGAVYVNNGFATQRPAPRQTSPVRNIERRASQMSNTDAVYSMNEQLKREVAQLEGEIRHQQYVHERTQDVNRNSYGNPVR